MGFKKALCGADKSIMSLPRIGEDAKDLNGLLKIFSIEKKKELTKHCKSLAINQSDLVSLIMAAKIGMLGSYGHVLRNKDLKPEHLEPTKEELKALHQSKVGCAAEGKANKAITKISQAFKDRRFFVAHFFYTSDHSLWHLLYFDQRDTAKRENHWDKGGHIHLINWLWPQYTLESVWKEVSSEKPVFQKSLHIQFKERKDPSDPLIATGD